MSAPKNKGDGLLGKDDLDDAFSDERGGTPAIGDEGGEKGEYLGREEISTLASGEVFEIGDG
jgi:hypothetical protein